MSFHNRGNLSIIGLYNWDNHIFDDMVLPSSLTRADIIKDILYECGELEVVYPDAEVMKDAIGVWSEEELFRWNKIQKLASLDYNPIENYDRIENETISDDTQKTGTAESTANQVNQRENGNSNTVENQVTGYNTTTPVTNTKQIVTGSDTDKNTAGSQAKGSSSESEKTNHVKNSRIHGNIGVSTPADMMKKELEIYPELNLHRIIPLEFKMRFCLMVY